VVSNQLQEGGKTATLKDIIKIDKEKNDQIMISPPLLPAQRASYQKKNDSSSTIPH
jgi:hypothetical protein